MSYITDEPLSPEEEKFYDQSVRQFRYQSSPPAPETREITASLNISRADYSVPGFSRLFSDFLKIQVPSSHEFLINQQTYNHLLKSICSRFQHRPLADLLICDSITIVPVPHQRCSLYFYPWHNKQNEQIEMQLVGSFVCDKYLRKLTVPCPFSDSFFGPDKKVVFNWYGNDKSGKIVPKTIHLENIESKYSNKTLPFLSPKQSGSYLITGIFDSIAFHVSFNVDVNWKYRFGDSNRCRGRCS